MFEDILSLFDFPFVLDVYMLITLGMFLFYCRKLSFDNKGVPLLLQAIRWIAVASSGSILWPVVLISWLIEHFRRWVVSK